MRARHLMRLSALFALLSLGREFGRKTAQKCAKSCQSMTYAQQALTKESAAQKAQEGARSAPIASERGARLAARCGKGAICAAGSAPSTPKARFPRFPNGFGARAERSLVRAEAGGMALTLRGGQASETVCNKSRPGITLRKIQHKDFLTHA